MLLNQLVFKEDPLAAAVNESLIRRIGSRLGRPKMEFKIGDLVIETGNYDHLAMVAGYIPIMREPDIWEWGYGLLFYFQGNPSFEGRNRRGAFGPESVRKAAEKDIKLHISGGPIWQRFGKH